MLNPHLRRVGPCAGQWVTGLQPLIKIILPKCDHPQFVSLCRALPLPYVDRTRMPRILIWFILTLCIPFLLHLAHLGISLTLHTVAIAHHVWHSRLKAHTLAYHSFFASLLHSLHSHRCLTSLHKFCSFGTNLPDSHPASSQPGHTIDNWHLLQAI